MVFYLISLHQVPLHLGTDLPLWKISWKGIDPPQEAALLSCSGHRQSCTSNGKYYQQPQCPRQGGEMGGGMGARGENLHWGQQLWAGLGVHPYVWKIWVRI